jgi:Fic family protein
MAQPFHKLLATSMSNAKQVARHQIIKTEDLSRLDRERLIRAGCLQKIVRGWYLFCKPGTDDGESTAWYASFWNFIRLYLEERFNENYCLSPEASMDIYLGKNYLPHQVVVIAKSGGSALLQLPHNTSLLTYQEDKNFPETIKKVRGLNVLPFEYALCKMTSSFFQKQSQDAEIALRMLKSPDAILHILLKEGMSRAAGRLAGAFRHIDKKEFAESILNTMRAAGFTITEHNPFEMPPLLSHIATLKSPYSARIRTLWEKMHDDIIKILPRTKKIPEDATRLFKAIDATYVQDAYHSLSIEGYQVSEALIEKIALGSWRPEDNDEDQTHKNAMAAKGYYEAFKMVKKTIRKMLKSKSPIKVLQKDFSNWYLALFSPAVTAGILSAEQLAGFRNQSVYIRGSRHIPLPHTALRDTMDTLFDCLEKEKNQGVQAVLAHFFIGFIHPYNDGNGRMARFMMNALLTSSGYPWTIIHVENRSSYLKALEKASIKGDIQDFAKFIKQEMKHL